MDKRIQDVNVLKNEFIKFKDEENKQLDEEEKEIEEKREEERKLLEQENENAKEEKENDTEAEGEKKNSFPDINVKSSLIGFFKNLNPFKKKELKPVKKEMPTIKYTPEALVDGENVMRALHITHKHETYNQTVLYNCPNNNFVFDTTDSIISELQGYGNRDFMATKILDHNNECLKSMGILDFELPDNKTKFGKVIGTFGNYHIKSVDIEADLVKYHPDLDYVTLADDYKLPKNETLYLENLNFCLLNPKKL
ncbi:rhoptry-associated protein 1, putative, partial [Plasmodium malariae]